MKKYASVIREVGLWTASLLGALLAVIGLLYEPEPQLLDIALKLGMFVAGLIICAAAGNETKFGRSFVK